MPRDMPPEDDIGPIVDRLEVGPIDPDAPRLRRKRRLIRRILLVTALVIGLGGGALFAQLRTKTTPISVDDSLSKFREHAGSGSPAPVVAGLPAPGVYVYTTSGQDEVNALGGSHHDYPNQTTLTVTPDSCGERFRWDALAERWESWVLCPDGERLEIRSIQTYHQFFGKGDEREYFCGDASLYRPVEETPGARWTARCAGANAVGTLQGKVIGIEYLAVGGTRIKALHYTATTTFTGSTKGKRTLEAWIAADTGLLLVSVSHDDVDTDSVLGQVHYLEQFRIELTSLTPQT